MSRADYRSRDLAGAARLARADVIPDERPSPDEYAEDRSTPAAAVVDVLRARGRAMTTVAVVDELNRRRYRWPGHSYPKATYDRVRAVLVALERRRVVKRVLFSAPQEWRLRDVSRREDFLHGVGPDNGEAF